MNLQTDEVRTEGNTYTSCITSGSSVLHRPLVLSYTFSVGTNWLGSHTSRNFLRDRTPQGDGSLYTRPGPCYSYSLNMNHKSSIETNGPGSLFLYIGRNPSSGTIEVHPFRAGSTEYHTSDVSPRPGQGSSQTRILV